MNQFCRENKIKVTTFHGWNKRYSNNPQPLVELPVKHKVTPSSSILVKRGNYHIEIKSNFDPVSLEKLLQVLEQLHD